MNYKEKSIRLILLFALGTSPFMQTNAQEKQQKTEMKEQNEPEGRLLQEWPGP